MNKPSFTVDPAENRPFGFQKWCQDFIGSHNETLSVAMRVHNPDRSPFKIDSGDPA
jgi:hypothetical protein